MANKPKKTASYDLKAADRRRNMFVQIGLTAVVVIFAVALVGYIVLSGKEKPASGESKAIRVATSKVVTKEGTTEPKVVLSLYEDFLCPVCQRFEAEFGPTINQLIDSGAVATDYYMVAILDSPATKNYSSRAGAAAYCVADEDKSENKDVFRRFHAGLYAQQPSETGTVFPTNEQLIETARQAGVVGQVPECINNGRYLPLVEGLAAANEVQATPTMRINGEDYQYSKPEDLVAKVKELVGDLPGVTPAPGAALPPAAPEVPIAPVPAPPAAPAPATP